MAGETLQDEVRSFLTQHIRSVVQLETLLLLRLDPQRVWSATELSRELRIDRGWAVEELGPRSRGSSGARRPTRRRTRSCT